MFKLYTINRALAVAIAMTGIASSNADADQIVSSDLTTFSFVIGTGTVDPFASSRFTITTEHVDLGIPYTTDGWDLHWHVEDTDIEYEPGDAYVSVSDAALITRPAGSQFDFIGVNAGEQFYLLPQNSNPAVVFLGVATEENEPGLLRPWSPPGGFDNIEQTALELISVTGENGDPAPGDFAMWTAGQFGGIDVLMATSDGISAGDAAFIFDNTHAHFNYSFSEAGVYEVTFRTTTNIVPEPASAALFGGAGLFALRRRRRPF